jgi:predicted RNA-binding Zn ribbon-like protein
MAQPGGRAPAPPELALAQDLANTVDIELGRDSLTTVDELAAFAHAHGVTGTFSKRDLDRARIFRELLRDVCAAHAGINAPAASITELNDLLTAAPIALSIAADGSASFRPAAKLAGASALLAEMAAGIAQALEGGTWIRLKTCAADECRWVYYDRSPAGRGRWCTMRICGSRAKVRAYRTRAARG